MAFWNRDRNYQNGILTGKDLSAFLEERKQERGFEDHGLSNYYKIGFWITAVISFIACWIYAIASWGFLLGVGLGWIPSLFIAVIAGFIWPLIALVLVVGLCIVVFLLKKN